MKVEKERILELEHAVVDGIDISGKWNRMFLERVITDYSFDLKDKVRDLLGAESFGYCYSCAQCTSVCPIDHINDNYGPRKVIRMTETGIDLFSDDNLWLCTTCGNCLRVCPKEVDFMKIMPAVREQAILDGTNVPKELEIALENSGRYGNPMGESPRKRTAWIKEDDTIEVPIFKKLGRKADWLWFVGDYPAYHVRGKDTAKAMARIFNRLKIDFAILGAEEQSDGDSQRLAGEKGLFEMLAEKNMAAFDQYEFDEIVVTGPHAYNAILNEYPKMDGGKSYPTRHYTQLMVEHLDEIKKLFVREIPAKITFHDPCYLGRHNGEYDAPRELLKAIPGVELVEMGRCKENGYCCGGGGGGQWVDLTHMMPERLSDRRVREAVETGSTILAVTCPYEVSRFEDGAKTTGNEGKIVVRDITELLDYAMGGDSPNPVL